MEVPQVVWWSFFLVAIYEVIHVGLFAASFDLPSYVGYVSFLFLMLFIGGSYDSRSDEANNALSFCIGSVVMLTIILLNFNQLAGEDFLEGSVRMGNVGNYLGEETMTLRTNPNNIGLYSIAAISIAFVLWFYKKIPVWLLVLVAILAFIGGVYSLSRTWMLTIALFTVLFFSMRRRGQRVSSIFILLLAVFGVFYFFTRMNVSVLDAFDTRFEGDSTAGLRTTLFLSYHEWMMSNPWAILFGTGAIPYKEVTQLANSTHNAIQQIFVAYGFPGLLFFACLLYNCIKRWRVSGERMVYVPIIVVGVFLQSLQFLNPTYCAYPLIATFYILKMIKKDKTMISGIV